MKDMLETLQWYRDEEGTTNNAHNLLVGITNMVVFQPTPKQAEHAMLASVLVQTVIGDIHVTIHQSKAYPDAIYLRVPQTKRVDEEGNVAFHDELKLNKKVKAQILRYVDSLLVEGELPIPNGEVKHYAGEEAE